MGLSTHTNFLCLSTLPPTTEWEELTPTSNPAGRFVSMIQTSQLSPIYGKQLKRFSSPLSKKSLLPPTSQCPTFPSALLTSHRKIRCLSLRHSGFSHHNAGVLKAAHCVCVATLTCLVLLDLSHRWQTLWATYYTFVLHFNSNDGLRRQKNDSLKLKSHTSKWHTRVPLVILAGIWVVVCLCMSAAQPPQDCLAAVLHKTCISPQSCEISPLHGVSPPEWQFSSPPLSPTIFCSCATFICPTKATSKRTLWIK